MKKLAIFVEGLTEQLFIQSLLREVAAKNELAFELKYAIGGKSFRRQLVEIKVPDNPDEPRAVVMIIDSGCDNRVMSDVRENYASLVEADYRSIIAVRDVYPEAYSDLPKLVQGAKFGIRTKPICVNVVFAIMEIEAWFIAEHTHFPRIHETLSVDVIRKKLGLDVERCAVEDLPRPAAQLNTIYQLAGLCYVKKRDSIQNTLESLDYPKMYFETVKRSKSFFDLVTHLDSFLAA